MKLGWFGALALVGAILGAGCTSNPEPKPKLRIGTNPWTGWAPIDVAKERGFWEKQGLDVEVVSLLSDQELATALAADRIDIAIGMIGTWVGVASQPGSPPLTIIAETNWSYGGDRIIAKRTVDATKLAGREVALYLNQPSVTFFLQQYMNELTPPLKVKDVTLKELEAPQIAEEFIKGTYDLTITFAPDSLPQLSPTAGGVEVATSRSYPGVIPEGFAMTTKKFGEIPRDTIRRALAGWLDAVDWIYGPAGDGQTPDPATWSDYKDILKKVTFATADGPAQYTDQEMDELIYGVHVHGRQLFKRVNGPADGTQLRRFNEADGTIPQPQTDGQPLGDFFAAMTQFLNDSEAPIPPNQITIDTSVALEAAQ